LTVDGSESRIWGLGIWAAASSSLIISVVEDSRLDAPSAHLPLFLAARCSAVAPLLSRAFTPATTRGSLSSQDATRWCLGRKFASLENGKCPRHPPVLSHDPPKNGISPKGAASYACTEKGRACSAKKSPAPERFSTGERSRPTCGRQPSAERNASTTP
jgi:hypothetical protein